MLHISWFRSRGIARRIGGRFESLPQELTAQLEEAFRRDVPVRQRERLTEVAGHQDSDDPVNAGPEKERGEVGIAPALFSNWVNFDCL